MENVIIKSVRKPNRFVYKAFRNASNSAEMNVNGASTPVTFKVTANETIVVERVLFVVTDVGMGYAEFGGLASVLTNGVEIKAFDSDNTLLIDFTDGLNIKTNEDWSLLAGVDVVLADSVTTDAQPIRWTISKAGYPMILEQGQYLQIKIQDDLTGLTKFRASLQGTYS